MSTEKQEVAKGFQPSEMQKVATLSGSTTNSTEFTSLGKCLQQARIQAGFTVQQIASEMHLEPKFIDFIERDRFKELGVPVFVKGHLRRYARLVNVDETLLQGLYESLRDPPVAVDPIPSCINSVHRPRKIVPSWSLWTAAGLFVFISIGTAVNKLSSPDSGQPLVVQVASENAHTNIAKSPLSEQLPLVATSSSVSQSPMVLASVAPVAVANARESDDATNPPRVIAPGHVALTLRFSGDSWVEVYDANKHSVFQEIGRNTNIREIDGIAPLRVVIGSAPQVAMQVNGRNVVIPTKRVTSSVARFSIEANGVIN